MGDYVYVEQMCVTWVGNWWQVTVVHQISSIKYENILIKADVSSTWCSFYRYGLHSALG